MSKPISMPNAMKAMVLTFFGVFAFLIQPKDLIMTYLYAQTIVLGPLYVALTYTLLALLTFFILLLLKNKYPNHRLTQLLEAVLFTTSFIYIGKLESIGFIVTIAVICLVAFTRKGEKGHHYVHTLFYSQLVCFFFLSYLFSVEIAGVLAVIAFTAVSVWEFEQTYGDHMYFFVFYVAGLGLPYYIILTSLNNIQIAEVYGYDHRFSVFVVFFLINAIVLLIKTHTIIHVEEVRRKESIKDKYR